MIDGCQMMPPVSSPPSAVKIQPSSDPLLVKPRKIQVGIDTTSPGWPTTSPSRPSAPQRKVHVPRWIMNTSAVKWTCRLLTVPGGMAATPRLKPCASVRLTTWSRDWVTPGPTSA